MGTYYNPTDEVPSVGRILEEGDFEYLQKQLKEDEYLFGLYDRLAAPFDNAVWLFSRQEMREFEDMITAGYVRRIGFFAIGYLAACKGTGVDLKEVRR